MKTANVKYFMIMPIVAFSFFMISVSTGTFAAKQDMTAVSDVVVQGDNDSQVDHAALARQYENLAKEMRAKIQEQIEALHHKPRTSFLGRNGQHIRSHVAYKIGNFEKSVQENMEKAAYHRKIAIEQSTRESVAQSTKIRMESASKNNARNQSNNKEESL